MKRLRTRLTNAQECLVKLDDFRIAAKATIPSAVFDYIDCGACDEITNAANRRDLAEIKLLPLCLRNVSSLDLSAKLLGQSFDLPIGFSPTAFHNLVHERGE